MKRKSMQPRIRDARRSPEPLIQSSPLYKIYGLSSLLSHSLRTWNDYISKNRVAGLLREWFSAWDSAYDDAKGDDNLRAALVSLRGIVGTSPDTAEFHAEFMAANPTAGLFQLDGAVAILRQLVALDAMRKDPTNRTVPEILRTTALDDTDMAILRASTTVAKSITALIAAMTLVNTRRHRDTVSARLPKLVRAGLIGQTDEKRPKYFLAEAGKMQLLPT